MTRPPLTNINPLDIFLHTSGFHQAEEHIVNIDLNKNPQLALEMSQAGMVLSAFICELYFKCLICLETNSVPLGHDLDDLFDQLSPDTQKRIENIWSSEIVPLRNPMWTKIEDTFGNGEKLSRDVRGAIKAGRRAFEKMRYNYEPNSKGSQFYIADLPRLLVLVIFEKKPEWRNIRRKVSEEPDGFTPHISA